MNNSLRLSKLESVRKSLDVLTSFLAPCLPFINAHNVDFFVKSYWNQFLPHKLREDLEQLPVSSKLLKSYVDSLSSGSWRNSDKPLREDVSFHNCTLHELVQKIGELGLENMKMSIPLDEIPFLQSEAEDRAAIKLDIGVAEAELQFDKFMSSKKMHEVETMSYLIYRAAKAAGEQRKESSGNGLENVDDTDTPERNPLGKRIKVGKLIDFGSGKGYLSSFLALLYKFRIFALDSSSGNTTAATERGERLQVRNIFQLAISSYKWFSTTSESLAKTCPSCCWTSENRGLYKHQKEDREECPKWGSRRLCGFGGQVQATSTSTRGQKWGD